MIGRCREEAPTTNEPTADLLGRVDPARRETVSAEVARRLLAYLLAGNVRPGEKIPSERKLAEALGVGRSIAREGLKSLTLLGLVEVRQGDGTYLRSTESELLPQSIKWGLLLGQKRTKDIVEARQHLEVILAGLAAQRRDDADLFELSRLLGEMRDATDASSFVTADVAFHLRVAQAAGNESLTQIMTSIRSLLQVWITRVMEAGESFQPSLDEHVAVYDAIRAGDPPTARRAMETHMEDAGRRLETTLKDNGQELPMGL